MDLDQLKFNPSHEWVAVSEVNGERIATVGITAFAIEQLTDLVYMALPKVGASVKSGQEFGEVESVKAVSPLYSPIDGEVVEVHTALVDQLDSLGDDPYDNGWIMKVKMASGAGLDHLLDHKTYQKQCADA